MLSANQISKNFGENVILRNASLNLNPGDRIGLIGPNGCGKTTLLRILAGVDTPDSGTVRKNVSLRIGYLPQGFTPLEGETVGDFLERAAPLAGAGGSLDERSADVERRAADLAAVPGDPAAGGAYSEALERLTIATAGGETRIPEILAALGLAEVPLMTPAAHLSGGQKTRLALARILGGRPQILLLDEPTNHLDIPMLEWLEHWLASFRGGALVVSHDRVFLDRTVAGILELDPLSHSLREYAGNYSAYQEQTQAERDRREQAYSDWRGELANLHSAADHLRGIAKFRKGGKADTNDGFARGFFANRGKGTMGRAKNIERRIERLETEGRVEKPGWEWQMKLKFDPGETGGNDVLTLEDLAVGYGEHILLRGINLRLRRGARAALTGANGSGKTTLLRTVTGALPPLAGRLRLGTAVRAGFMAQEQETLDPARNALETVLAEQPASETNARRFLHYFLFSGDDVFTPIGNLSHGERARLLLALLVVRGCNFLLLDEPINHLDLPSRARFEQALGSFDGTVLTVVHDRYFIGHFASEVWEVEEGTVRKVG